MWGNNMSKIINNTKNGKFDLNNLESKDVASIFKVLVESKKEYDITKEVETTKRYKIEQNTKSYLEALKAQQSTMEKILSEQFNQRKEAIDKMFECLDKALDTDKDEIVIAALNSITEVVKTPVTGYQTVRQAFDSDDDLVL